MIFLIILIISLIWISLTGNSTGNRKPDKKENILNNNADVSEKTDRKPELRFGYPRYVDKARGLYTDYHELLDTDEWRSKRKRILERDEHRCRFCGSDYMLNVHHKYYSNINVGGKSVSCDPWDYPDDALITLCNECHRKWHKEHKTKSYWRKRYEHWS